MNKLTDKVLFLIQLEAWIILDGIDNATLQIGIGNNSPEGVRQHWNGQCKGTRHPLQKIILQFIGVKILHSIPLSILTQVPPLEETLQVVKQSAGEDNGTFQIPVDEYALIQAVDDTD